MQKILFDNLSLALTAKAMSKLRTLCSNGKGSPPTTKGGGETVAELEEIAKRYGELNDALCLLIGNTAEMLANAGNSMADTDATLAGAFRAGDGTQNILSEEK